MTRQIVIFITLFITVAGLLVGSLALPKYVLATTLATAADDFIPEIPIPGLFEGAQKMDNNLMANYVRAMFVYFVWVVGIVATVMVVYGGIKWVGAAGNPGQIKDARDIIDSAVIGVIIALTSIVLLNIINPKLTSLNITGINPIVKIPFIFENGCITNLSCPEGLVVADCSQCSNGTMASGCNVYTRLDAPTGCGGNTTMYGLCCRKEDNSQCIGLSVTTGEQTNYGKCAESTFVVKISYSACSDATACGVIKDTGKNQKCIGVTCPGPNQLCDPRSLRGTQVPCIDPSQNASGIISTTYKLVCTTSGNPSIRPQAYTSSLPCGAYTATTPQAWGVQSCPAGKYCQRTIFGVSANNKTECDIQGLRTDCVSFSVPPNTSDVTP